jgi:serine/threonine protein kinase/WD40 repeat protein
MNTLNVVESIFFAALDKDTPESRAVYLDTACKGDANLRRCVERLLNAHPKADAFMRAPAAGLPETIEPPAIEERPGSIIGPYKLLQQLGEGGFGVVFMAEQEQPVRRKVALKIIKPGMDSKQVIARFEAERQALAMMDHPNIARVLDGGTTDSNRPYFVMELVKGVPITEFCDRNRLTPRERLDLFVQVCNAVQHAHQKGVIHRDLKPSNVLVTMYDDKPVPKVIDFGVAKAIEQKLTEQTMFTRVGQVIGTLEYMSPEQASLNALDVDTRSDVYALGVLLYELLTGTTPLNKERLEGVAFLEMLRLIREEEPLKPSTRLTQSGDALAHVAAYRKSDSQKLPREVRGELDWIAMKALDKDRARRYSAASALAADVQRYLRDEHVEACPPTLGYRLQKYARKHKALFGSVSVAATLLIIGIAATSWQALRATRAEGNALKLLGEKQEALQAEAKQHKTAEELLIKAENESKAHQLARAELRRNHYAAAMNLIPVAWQARNVKRVVDLLEEQRPQPGDKDDVRGFEWHYWDKLCHAERRSLPPLDANRSLGFSADGTRFAYASRSMDDPTSKKMNWQIKVVDTASGREVFACPFTMIPNVSGGIGSRNGGVTMNRNGTRLALFVLDGAFTDADKPFEFTKSPKIELNVWNVESRTKIFSRKGASLRELVFSPDGKRIAIMGEREDSVAVLDLADPEREPIIMNHGETRPNANLDFSPDGSCLAGVFYGWGPSPDKESDSRIYLWDATTGKVRAKAIHEGPVFEIAFSPDGSKLAGVGYPFMPGGGSFVAGKKPVSLNELRLETYLWDAASSEELKLLRAAPVREADNKFFSLAHLVISPDGKRLATWKTMAGFVTVTDVATGEAGQVVRSSGMPDGAAFNSDGTRLFTSEYSDDVRGVILREWDVLPDSAASAASKPNKFPDKITIRSKDGERQAIFSPYPDSTSGIRVLDKVGKEIHEFRAHTARILGADFNGSGRLVCSWTASGEAKIWEAETGKVHKSGAYIFQAAQKKKGTPTPLPATPLSPDGRFLALLEDNQLRILSFDDLRVQFEVDAAELNQFYLSPDSRRLVTFTADREKKRTLMKLWDLESGRVLTSAASVFSNLSFSDDSRWFVTSDSFIAEVLPPLSTSSNFANANQLKIWDAATGAQRAAWTNPARPPGSPFGKFVFSPDGARLAIVGGVWLFRGSMAPLVCDTLTGKVIYRLEGHAAPVAQLAFSPDGKRIATITGWSRLEKDEMKVWDAVTGRELLSLQFDSGGAPFGTRLFFSPDGHRLTLAPLSGAAITWDATPRAEPAK